MTTNAVFTPATLLFTNILLTVVTLYLRRLSHIAHPHPSSLTVLTPHYHVLPSPHTSPHPPPHLHNPPPPLGVMCPIPEAPLDGDVSWSGREKGAALYYNCKEGFDLVGTASQECLSSGEWSSSMPLCMLSKPVGGDVCEWAHLL